MLSNHYSFTYTHPHNWMVLTVMMFAGAAIRQFFVLRHGFKLGRNRHPWPYAAVGVLGLLALLVALKPAPENATKSVAIREVNTAAAARLDYKNIQPVLAQRCYQCHGEAVQMKNVRLDSEAAVVRHAQAVYQQVVVTKSMPMNNSTGITEAERKLIGQWFEAGATGQ